jgi:imidazolonepropionase-like amidohydrolase
MTVLAAAGRTRELLQLGFTTIRNLGDPSNVSRDLRDAIGLGQVEGPRMIVAGGAQIGVSGGDYDPGALRLSESAEALALTEGQCDSVEACRKAVRSAFGRGADVIKMRLSSVSLVKTNVKRLERQDEINAIVETAHDLGLRVATHASTDDRAAMAIAAGADTIEHSPLSALSIAAMKTNGTAYTPTLQAAKQLGPMIKAVTGKDYFADASASAREAYEAGVPVLLGSDLGAVSVSDVPLEFERLAEAGIPLDGVLAAGTSAAAKALGMSDRIGAIKSGMAADIVAMQLNPLDDASAYGTVVFVMKGGKVYRDDLQTVPFDK